MPTAESRLKQVMADVFGIDAASVNEQSSMETIERWDSMNHLKLIMALEEQFDVAFSEDQIVQLFSYELIRSTLSEHGIVFN